MVSGQFDPAGAGAAPDRAILDNTVAPYGRYYRVLYIDVFELDLIFWMAHVVPLGYAFYLTGMLLRRCGLLERNYPRGWVITAAVACLALVTLTYNWNQGPFRLLEVVVMLFGTVGHPVLFPITALLGSALVILIARLLGNWRWLQQLGEITI